MQKFPKHPDSICLVFVGWCIPRANPINNCRNCSRNPRVWFSLPLSLRYGKSRYTLCTYYVHYCPQFCVAFFIVVVIVVVVAVTASQKVCLSSSLFHLALDPVRPSVLTVHWRIHAVRKSGQPRGTRCANTRAFMDTSVPRTSLRELRWVRAPITWKK